MASITSIFDTKKTKDQAARDAEWKEWDKRHSTVTEPDVSVQKPKVVIWNTPAEQTYKLKYYNYFSEVQLKEFDVKYYNKLNKNMLFPPKQRYYLRFDPVVYVTELESKPQASYGAFMTESNPQDLVYNKQYKGVYSRQADYFRFKQETSKNSSD